MLVDSVEHREDECPNLRRTPNADDSGDFGREIVGAQDARAAGVFEVVTDVRDAIGPRDDLALGRRGRGAAPGVVANAVERLDAQVERFERDVGAVDRVVVAAGEIGREGVFGGVPRGAVPAVVGEGDRLDERNAQVGDPGDTGGDLGDLDGVGEAGAQVVVFGGHEHLALARQPPPRTRVLDAVEVALEAQPKRVGFLGPGTGAGAGRPGCSRCEARRELGLARFAPQERAADHRERVGVCVAHRDVGIGGQREERFVHTTNLATPYDTKPGRALTPRSDRPRRHRAVTQLDQITFARRTGRQISGANGGRSRRSIARSGYERGVNPNLA